ncbi:hypothetical protein [Streptomyces sp. NPDC002952]|uniref:hypothetical protein n=1 Tax=Streptomyces sp. NPDC002952 TaxID=3364673 RepID=UPI0036CBF15E
MAALSAAALLGGGLTAQAAAPARTTGGAVELAPAGALATQCYYRVNASGGLLIRSGPGTSSGPTPTAPRSSHRWVSSAYTVRITSYPCE